MNGTDWEIDYQSWRETWHRGPDGGFGRVTVGLREYAVERDDLTALRPRGADCCAVCRRALPQAFTHCFACGTELSDLPAPSEPCQSAPNSGRPDAGLPPLSLVIGSAPRVPVALPEVGRKFAFAVAGSPVRLFALDRDGGWLHEFDRKRPRWIRLAALGEILLPERSWGMAAANTGIAVASAGRLAILDLIAGPLPRLLITPLREGETCLGAPCLLKDEALALVSCDGALQLARRQMANGGAWAFDLVQGSPALAAVLDISREAFSAPTSTQTGASWAGLNGFVVVSMGDDDTPGAAIWRSWSDGFSPFLQHRAYVDPDGGVWQFGSMLIGSNKRGLGFERMGFQSHRDRERTGGSVLASGILACRLLTLRHRAWVENSPYDRNLPGKDGDFLVPVLALDRERCVLMNAMGSVTELVNADADGLNEPIMAGLRFFDGQTPRDLGLPLNLRTLSQVGAFVFAGALHVYDSHENECWRWELGAAE